MLKKWYIVCLGFFCLFLYGCASDTTDEVTKDKKETNEKVHEGEGETVSGIDIFDFYFINKAPIATEKNELDDLIKIYFSNKNIAVDLGNNELYETPRFSTNGVATFEDPLEFHDQEGLIDILKKYNVQSWESDYTTEDPDSYQDGFGWMMLLQFKDGTIERYKGSGPVKEDVIPENFDAFADEIAEFVHEKIRVQ